MRGKEGKTLKKDTTHTIKRAQRFPVILIGEGLLVGAVGGLLVLLYRWILCSNISGATPFGSQDGS